MLYVPDEKKKLLLQYRLHFLCLLEKGGYFLPPLLNHKTVYFKTFGFLIENHSHPLSGAEAADHAKGSSSSD
jgi:hypothetical protein